MKTARNENTWCVNPYMNLDIHPSGMVKPCCMSTLEYVTDTGFTRLNQASIQSFWNSRSRYSMIERLNSGIQLDECSSCWREEQAGKESKRIRDNRSYKDRNLDPSMTPIVLALSLGNLCNIKCRICSPVHSTPWMAEEAQIQFKEHSKLYYQNPKWKSFKESFDSNNTFVWEDLNELLKDVEKMDFAGGEPFYIDNHWKIVKYCVDQGLSKKQYIHYNTNGTIFPEKYIDYLKEFEVVDIQISSDGLKEKFEYLRHPAKWNLVEENLKKFIEVSKKHSNWIIGICYSLSAFNIFDFFETFEYYADLNLPIYVNIVHDHRGVRILPDKVKEILINRLKNQNSIHHQKIWQKERDMVCSHLENSTFDKIAWDNFINNVNITDNFRNESFRITFPDYFEILKSYIK